MITDMTEGKPSGVLWKFTIPMLVSVMFQQLYNIVDSIVAGKFVGVKALAAVGASYPITMIFMAVATGLNIGCSVVISLYFGAKEYKQMKCAISTSLLTVLGISAVLTALGLVFSRPLMTLLKTPEDIFSDSALYLNIYIGGLIFLFMYNICTGVFTALGDSRTPLYFLIASSLGNIVLDLVFVINFHMGVSGVAWATFLAQGLSSVLAFFTLQKRLKAVESKKYKLFSGSMLKKIMEIAIPSILQQSFISVGNLFVQGLINSYGSAVVAGYSAGMKINTFAITSFTTLGNGLSSFTAQNIGAQKTERVAKGFRSGVIMVLSVAVPVFLLFFIGGRPTERRGGDEGLHDCHFFRPYSACSTGFCVLGNLAVYRYLAVLAGGVADWNRTVSGILFFGSVEEEQADIKWRRPAVHGGASPASSISIKGFEKGL